MSDPDAPATFRLVNQTGKMVSFVVGPDQEYRLTQCAGSPPVTVTGVGPHGVMDALMRIVAANHWTGRYNSFDEVDAMTSSSKALVGAEEKAMEDLERWEGDYDRNIAAGEDPDSPASVWTWRKVEDARRNVNLIGDKLDKVDLELTRMWLHVVIARTVETGAGPDQLAPENMHRSVTRLTGGELSLGRCAEAILRIRALEGCAYSRLVITKL